MGSYTMIVMADVLMAVTFALQKKYQEKAGVSIKASLVYTILLGVFSSALFFVLNKMTLAVTPFSIVMATLISAVGTAYVFIGFHVMKKGNMSIYTLFLMTGGMTVPYLYGVLFLNEPLTLMRTVGLFLIIGAIVVANFKKGKMDKEMIFLCITVFLLNGICSVIAKTHQISFASEIVSSSDFAFLVMITKTVGGLLCLLVYQQVKKGSALPKIRLSSVVWLAFFAAIADGVSYLFQLMGAVDVPATVLYPLVTGGTIAISSLTDCFVFKEKPTFRQLVGIVVAFLGTFFFL